MNRRGFLKATAATFLGFGTHTVSRKPDELPVSIWFSEAASEYSTLPERVSEYIETALAGTDIPTDVTVVDEPVSLPAESGARVLSRTWPRLVMQGRTGLGDLRPVDGVNLLVTDGDPRTTPSGYGYPGVAATTGAQYMDRMTPVDETPPVVPYSLPSVTTQLMLHEVGHAIGLDHEHGTVFHDGDGVATTTPMLSSYAWKNPEMWQEPAEHRPVTGAPRSCVSDELPEKPRRWQVQLRYGDCATRIVHARLS